MKVCPEKPNVIYMVKEFMSIKQTFSSLVKAVADKILDVPKTIIYCR